MDTARASAAITALVAARSATGSASARATTTRSTSATAALITGTTALLISPADIAPRKRTPVSVTVRNEGDDDQDNDDDYDDSNNEAHASFHIIALAHFSVPALNRFVQTESIKKIRDANHVKLKDR